MKEKMRFVLLFVLIGFGKNFDLLSASEHFFVSSLNAFISNSDSGAFS